MRTHNLVPVYKRPATRTKFLLHDAILYEGLLTRGFFVICFKMSLYGVVKVLDIYAVEELHISFWQVHFPYAIWLLINYKYRVVQRAFLVKS